MIPIMFVVVALIHPKSPQVSLSLGAKPGMARVRHCMKIWYVRDNAGEVPSPFWCLEQKPQPDLDLTGGVESRGNRLSDRLVKPSSAVENRRYLCCKVGIVQDIKHLSSELEFQLLAPKVLVFEN